VPSNAPNGAVAAGPGLEPGFHAPEACCLPKLADPAIFLNF